MTMAAIALGVTAVGVGMSAAGAAGAFSSKVDPYGPTPEELQAAGINDKVFQQGQEWQKQLDPLSWQRLDQQLADNIQQANYLGQYQQRLGGLKKELNTLNRPGFYQDAADRSVNQAWQQMPNIQQGLQGVSARSGGAGSGQFFAGLGSATNGMDAAVKGANLQGRLGYLDQYNKRRGQYGQQLGQFGQRLDAFGSGIENYANASQNMFGDYQQRIGTGLDMVNRGAGQAADSQSRRIQAQVNNNIATNNAMGQIGGSLTSVGMMGFGAAGGFGALGGMGAGPNLNDAGVTDMLARRMAGV
jgi:hypothetical protein